MTSRPNPVFTPDEYLELERRAATRSEYVHGQIYAMAGASPAHSILTANLTGEFYGQLLDRPCTTFPGDMRLKVSATGMHTYPDVTVVCGPPRYDDKQGDNLLNPTLLVEVLSPSTERYDRGDKFGHYRTLDSLQEYLLVSQKRPQIERFLCQPDGSWLLTIAQGLDATLGLPSIGCTLALSRVYARVPLDAAAAQEPGPGEG